MFYITNKLVLTYLFSFYCFSSYHREITEAIIPIFFFSEINFLSALATVPVLNIFQRIPSNIFDRSGYSEIFQRNVMKITARLSIRILFDFFLNFSHALFKKNLEIKGIELSNTQLHCSTYGVRKI